MKRIYLPIAKEARLLAKMWGINPKEKIPVISLTIKDLTRLSKRLQKLKEEKCVKE